MIFNTTLGNVVNNPGKRNSEQSSADKVIFGRVVDIILDETHEQYSRYGEVDSINGVFFKDINDSIPEIDSNNALSFAYNYDSNIMRVPLPGELIVITKEPSNTLGGGSYDYKYYYKSIISVWNTPHFNALPDTKVEIDELDLGVNAKERGDITGIQPFTGDFIVEGRLGQSLRFSGFKHPKNNFTDDDNNSLPFAILKVGQDPEFNELTRYVEDINKDSASIYLTSDHLIPLNIATTKVDTFKSEDEPIKVDKYRGNQVVIDSGRLVFHSKTDSLFLNSKKAILAGSETFNIDSTSYISLDAPEVFIGRKAIEPAVLGDKTEILLRRLLELLNTVGKGFNAVKDPISAGTVLSGLGPIITAEINTITSNLSSIKSKKVKIE